MRCRALVASVALTTIVIPSAIGLCHARELTVEDRVSAREAIERVYWSHRLWPEENSGSKPRFEAVFNRNSIQTDVEETLRKSNALAALWGNSITHDQLQAEITRMAETTQDPATLGELFAAVGNDPAVIAEVLARPALADRLIRSMYARDPRFHSVVKRRAQEALGGAPSIESLKETGAIYNETRYVRTILAPDEGPRSETGEDLGPRAHRAPDDPSEPGVAAWSSLRSVGPSSLSSVDVDEREWPTFLAQVAASGGATIDCPVTPDSVSPQGAPGPASAINGLLAKVRIGVFSALYEENSSFSVTVIVSKAHSEIRIATLSWPKVPFEEWWGREQETVDCEVAMEPNAYTLPTVAVGGCRPDSWSRLPGPFPRGAGQSVVWTGSEMIVWGGSGHGINPVYHDDWNSGARYKPATDTWEELAPAPLSPRAYHSAIWTGTEMIVWGGLSHFGSTYGGLNDGARYNPSTKTWAPISAVLSPWGRGQHAALWTGRRMLVWGGNTFFQRPDQAYYALDGGQYDPATDTWAGIPDAPIEGREGQLAVWTGRELILWGGYYYDHDFNPVSVQSGARFEPFRGRWSSVSSVNAPATGESSKAVWTGTQVLVWGSGQGDRYDPATNRWTPTSSSGAPPDDGAVEWTGSEMLVWTGSTGGRYDPVTDRWSSMAAGGPGGSGSSVWTGSEMIVWTGGGGGTVGARYRPASNVWIPMGSQGAPPGQLARLWTGSEMIAWGTSSSPVCQAAGARYDPATNGWSSISTVGAPLTSGPVVWTGAEMLTASGDDTIGSYNPALDTWQQAHPTGTPEPRSGHTAVWDGTEVIVWGGRGAGSYSPLNSGGRYKPGSDPSHTTSLLHALDPACYSVSVWAGTELMVWEASGGCSTSTSYLDGRRYDPEEDIWRPIAPSALFGALGNPSAVWTGHRVIVFWGDANNEGCLPTIAGIYDPDDDSWGYTAPSSCSEVNQSAIWTGSEMILWGGRRGWFYVYYQNSGERYDPVTDGWRRLEDAGAPNPSESQQAVWTGTQMVVSGGLYCVCGSYYRDLDHDGYGNPAVSSYRCDGMMPAGYVRDGGDCADGNSSIHPGAIDVCDGIDNNCDGQIDEDAHGADADQDGIQGACDNCPTAANTDQADGDGDGVGNVCDNCPTISNSDQRDTDEDGVGDAGDPDDDNDGAPDLEDNCPELTNPTQLDADGDGTGDPCDVCPNDPLDDADGDLICGGAGYMFPMELDHDDCPAVSDTAQKDNDGDGVGDACDNCPFTCWVPYSYWSRNRDQHDLDGDGTGDACDVNDGLILLNFVDRNFMVFQEEQGFSQYAVYRGSIGRLRATDEYTQSAGPEGERWCNADYGLVDTWVPAPGQAVFYLVAGTTPAGVSSLGTDSSGVERPNTRPCPMN